MHSRRLYDSDAAIWCIHVERTNVRLPSHLGDLLEEQGGFVFTADMLSQEAESLEGYDRLSSHPFMLFFEPPSIGERIVNQDALLSDPGSASALDRRAS